jgi:hypothetical protein
MTALEQTDQELQASASRKIWLFCVWSWPLAIVAFGVPFVFLAGFVPPPSPAWSAQELSDFFADNTTGIRVGIIAAMFASGFLLPFYTVVSAEIKKIEGEPGLLGTMQFGGAVMLVLVFQLICLVWITASFRPGTDPQITQTLNDFCWFVWSTFIPTYMVQFFCMAVAGFLDKRERPLWPRWAAYMNLWVAVTGAGGVLAVFFKTGPFAWNGIIGFWIPVILFVVGMSVTTALLLRRRRYEDQLATPSGLAAPA